MAIVVVACDDGDMIAMRLLGSSGPCHSLCAGGCGGLTRYWARGTQTY